MEMIRQGDVIKIPGLHFHVLVLSRLFFNQSGIVIVCPVLEKALPDALHFPITYEDRKGIALLEQMKSLDLTSRLYRHIGTIDFEQIQDISDAAQGIFDYYPYSDI